jgi:ribonuclease G
MTRTVLINAGIGEIRIGVVEDGRLEHYAVHRLVGDDGALKRARTGKSLVGNIVLARVQRVMRGMQAAFVDIGQGRAGFLAGRDAQILTSRAPRYVHADVSANADAMEDVPAADISDCVREGEQILVQVVKDPIGDKGARVSAHITLAGRLLILAPGHGGIALSRRIEDEAERIRLALIAEKLANGGDADLVKGAGYIVRTAAIGASEENLRADAADLARQWQDVVDRRKISSAPAILGRDLEPVQRAMRDEVDAETTEVLIDEADALVMARAYAERAMPQMQDRIHRYVGKEPIFEAFGFEDDIAQLNESRVPLPSGGWITLDTMEALTAIDVNSGSYIQGTALEETGLTINLEAAREIGRQLRLRGIGGQIVVDFIHLDRPENIARVLDCLRESAAKDRAPVQILGMSEFGLVEMTRKRTRDPLARWTTEICPCCEGIGRRKTAETVGLEILRGIERAAAVAPGKAVRVFAAPDVIKWMEQHQALLRASLSGRGIAQLAWDADAKRAHESFSIETAG